MKKLEFEKDHPIPIYAAAELLALGKPSDARKLLEYGFSCEYAALLLECNDQFSEFGIMDAIHYPLDRRVIKSMLTAYTLNARVSGLSEFEQRLLNALRLVNDTGELTQYGINRTIEHLPLKAQCTALKIPLTEVSIPKTEKDVEIDVLNFLKISHDYSAHCEAGPFIVLLYCVLTACLRELAYSDSRYRDILRSRGAVWSILSEAYNDKKMTEVIIRAFIQKAEEITMQDIDDCLKKEFRGSFESEMYPAITRIQTLNLFNALTSLQIRAIAEFVSSSPWQNKNGWPDLTIFDCGKVRLTEVKVSDRLHYNQISTIPRLKSIFDSVSVLRVSRLPNQLKT